jgi:hypothetical protein
VSLTTTTAEFRGSIRTTIPQIANWLEANLYLNLYRHFGSGPAALLKILEQGMYNISSGMVSDQYYS